MATVYRKTYTMIMPKNVEIVQRDGKSWAKWTNCNGKKHLDPTTVGRRGQLKIIRYAPTFFAQYRDADGQMVIESTGCRAMTEEELGQLRAAYRPPMPDWPARTGGYTSGKNF
jgi:hypothetical protein